MLQSIVQKQLQVNYLKSPLRYPGGKSRAVKHIFQYIDQYFKDKSDREVCSPFFGGGSLEIFCVQNNIRVYGYDIFRPLVDFWQCLSEDRIRLADMVEEYRPLEREQFYRLQQSQMHSKNKFERAVFFFVLNRTSFSGSTLSGGMASGGNNDNPRFTESSIDRLREFELNNLIVKLADFKKSIAKHKDALLYLDPPYLIHSKLYGTKGDLHKNFDHKSLADILKQRESWILSYNNSEEIHNMYSGYKILYPDWKYGMSNDKTSREVLILSHDVAKKSKLE